MIVYLDLDRTLFQTHKLSLTIWNQVALLYPEIDPKAAHEDYRRYLRYNDDLYYYDIGAQLEDLGLNAKETYRQLHDHGLADGRLEFEGVSELVSMLKNKAEVKVLTFGDDKHQRFKASLCPSLDGIEVITTRQPKHLYFQEHDEPSWLVDDKPIGNDLPDTVRFIQVSLEGNPIDHSVSWPVFTSLHEVKEVISNEMH